MYWPPSVWRQCTAITFSPSWKAVTPVHRPESLVGDWTLHFIALANVSDGIRALETNGFRVGSIAEVNQNTTKYYWMAFGPADTAAAPRVVSWKEVAPY